MEKTKKVLHILNSLAPSGAEVMLEIANSFWEKHGIKGEILSTGKEVGEYRKNLEKAGFKIYHIPLKPKLLFIIKFIRHLSKNRYDIIHIHSEGASFYSALCAKLTKHNKIIRTVHHIWSKQRILPFIKRKYLRYVTNRIFKVKAVSNSFSGHQNELFYYNMDNLLIPNWYNDNKFIPITYEKKQTLRKKYEIDESTKVIASLGGNWPYKNYDKIIHALAKLPNNSNILYFQIGFEQEDKPLQRLATKLKVNDKIKFWGVSDNVVELLHLSDCYIMPSNEEGFGNAAIEAMSCGLVPILSDVKALSDYKKYYEENEIIWCEPSVDSLVEVFKKIMKISRIELFKKGYNLHVKTKKQFGIEIGAKKYLELYKEI